MFDKIAKKYKNYEFGSKSDGRSFLKVVEHVELQENAVSIFNDSTCLSFQVFFRNVLVLMNVD